MNMVKNLIQCLAIAAIVLPALAQAARVPPIYPEYAAENCIEGYVRLEYTFTSEGRPSEIRIVEANPPGVFEEATLKNISHWRFPERAGETEIETIKYSIENTDDCDS